MPPSPASRWSTASLRGELLAQVAYSDRLQAADGTVIDETAPTDFSVTYVLGGDGTQWRLHDYIPGS